MKRLSDRADESEADVVMSVSPSGFIQLDRQTLLANAHPDGKQHALPEPNSPRKIRPVGVP